MGSTVDRVHVYLRSVQPGVGQRPGSQLRALIAELLEQPVAVSVEVLQGGGHVRTLVGNAEWNFTCPGLRHTDADPGALGTGRPAEGLGLGASPDGVVNRCPGVLVAV